VAGAEPPDDPVRDRLPVHGHANQALAGVLDRFLDRQRHLARLSVADPDHRALIADSDQGGEREAPAALDDLGDAIDLDHALLQVEALWAYCLDLVIHAWINQGSGLELEPTLARALGESPDAAVVPVAAAIEDAGPKPRLLCPLGEQPAGPLCLLHRPQLPQLGLGPGHRDQGASRIVVDELRG
jgi:hypothetical protein